ncbi:MAG: sulfatase [Elusimicrobia bacterium]|nr:sulfatase [Candidatus Liberimonas magnetica]
MNKFFKYFILLILSFAALITIAIALNTLSYGLNYFGLSKAMNSIIKRQQLILNNSAQFDKAKILKNLKPNPINSFYYMFDEHLSDAEISVPKNKISAPGGDVRSYLIKFAPDKKSFSGSYKEVYISSSQLTGYFKGGKYVNIRKDLNIPLENIKDIEIKLKTNRNNKMMVYLSDETEFDSNKIDTSIKGQNIDVIPDGNYHTYIIDPLLLCYYSKNTVKSMCLYFRVEDNIDIEYINFVPSKNKYYKTGFGNTYESKNDIIKMALYFATPGKARYSLKIPKGRIFFKSSIGVLKDNDPVKFNVIFKNSIKNEIIYSKTISNPSNWFDFKIDVTKWTDSPVELILEAFSDGGNIAFWGNPVIYELPKERFNIIIWLEDTLRPDKMSCYGYKRNTTPVKTSLFKDGIIFLNAISQTTETPTSCSSFMTSLYPSLNGVWCEGDLLDDKFLRLPEIMRNQGFETAAFSQNMGSSKMSNLHLGYSMTSNEEHLRNILDPDTSNILLGWLDSNTDRNIFVYVHQLDPHGPYKAPRPFDLWYLNNRDTKTSKVEQRHVWLDPPYISTPTLQGRRDLYDGAVRHNDFVFAKLVNKLKKLGIYDKTLIIHIADHGEFLGEHNFWQHQPPSYRQVIKVPLLIYYPDKLPKNLKIKQSVQLLDVAPTILDLANIDTSPFILQGDSLLSLIFGKDKDYWNNRLLISEEITAKNYSGPLNNTDASLIYKRTHILYSNSVTNDFLSWLLQKSKANCHLLRFFNLNTDKTEEGYFNNYLPNLFLYRKVKKFLYDFQANNLKIFENIVKTKKPQNKLTQEEIKTLRSMGYLQ